MSDIENILAGIPSEDAAALVASEESTEEGTPAESPTAKKATEETPSPDGVNNQDESNLPFHKHPRWKEMHEARKRAEESTKRLEDELSSLRAELAEKTSTRVPEAPSERFVKLYGDDPEAYRLWKEQQEELIAKAEERVFQRMNQEQEMQARALDDGRSYVENALADLEAEHPGLDRNALMKFLVDFKEKYGSLPSDAEDNIDFVRGYSLMMEMQAASQEAAKSKSKARKDLAAMTSKNSASGEPEQKEYLTSKDLRNMDWDTIGR